MKKKMKFKTNLMCEGCKSRITPLLDREEGIESWQVDLEDENKILTVESDDVSGEEVIDILQKAGYLASFLN